MKTKTLIQTLVSLNIIPSGYEPGSADILPEAVLLKNIIHQNYQNIRLLLSLIAYMESPDCRVEDFDPRLLPVLKKLARSMKVLLAEQQPSVENCGLDEQVEEYDADTEETDDRNRRSRQRRRRSRNSLPGSAVATSGHDSNVTDQKKTEAEFVAALRDIVLFAQDKEVLRRFRDLVRPDEHPMPFFVSVLNAFREFALDEMNVPLPAYLHENDTLCQSINVRYKLDRYSGKFKKDLDRILDQREKAMAEKVKEKVELQAQVDRIQNRSMDLIKSMKTEIDNRIKVVEWNSKSKQTELREHIFCLMRELQEVRDEHMEIEMELRHGNIALEKEVNALIQQYDEEMFKRHREIDLEEQEYAAEKTRLAELQKSLKEMEAERDAILEERRLTEETNRNAKLLQIRQVAAAKVIQRAWRQFKMRMAIKAKKKKKKK